MKKYLVSIETVKIKDFIFNTNKLKVIRGASYLLDYLNQVKIPQLLEEEGVEEKDILYIAAGNAKFYVESEKKAQEIIAKAKAMYKDYAPNAKLVGSFLEVGQGQKDWDIIDQLAKVTAKEKSKGFPEINIDLPFIEKCMICNDKPVEVKKDDKHLIERYENLYIKENIISNEKLSKRRGLNEVLGAISNNEDFKSKKSGICSECLAKLLAVTYVKEDSEKVGIYHRRDELEDFISGDNIEDYKNNKSFIGFVYADGDSLGDFLKKAKDKYKKIDDEKGYRVFMKEFSKALDKNTKDAFIDTLIELKDKFPLKDGKILYGEFLIVGGDDVCGIFHGDIALEVSTLFQKKLEEKMVEFEEKHMDKTQKIRNNITASSGVIIAKAKTPLFYLFDQSLKLQKSAKAKRYEDLKKKLQNGIYETNKGYVDFQVIGSEGNTDISKFRENLDKVMERPYLVDEENKKNKITIDTLVNLITNLKEVKFPKNKLRKFYELKKEDQKQESLFDFLNLVSRLDKESRLVMFTNWIENEDLDKVNFLEDNLKNIFDVLEMYDFVGGAK